MGREVRITPRGGSWHAPSTRTAAGRARPSDPGGDGHSRAPTHAAPPTKRPALPRPIAGRPDYRGLILTTRLVPHVAIWGQLAPDDVIELIDIDIDLHGLAASDPLNI